MSRYIGKRVFYHCSSCGKTITLNKKTIDESASTGNIYCSINCKEMIPIESIQKQLENMQNEDMDSVSWGMQEGILISGNQAKEVIKLQKENDELRKLFNNLPKYEDMPPPIQDEENYKKVLKFWFDTVKEKLTKKEV